MRIALVYVRVPGNPAYEKQAGRWLETYKDFGWYSDPHLFVINRYTSQCQKRQPFDSVGARYLRYDGDGWDCGSYQFAAKAIDADLMVVFNTGTYFWRDGWLSKLAEAAQQLGPKAILGVFGSFEARPHLRTSCLAFHPDTLRAWPNPIDSRDACLKFEASGIPNFVAWYREHGYGTYLVTWDGVYDMPDWRKPANGFRSGTQQDCLIWDRHCDIYAGASPEEKQRLENAANGKPF